MTARLTETGCAEAVRAGSTEQHVRRIPGEEGIWVFVLGDMAVFALFFGTILVMRGEQSAMFAHSQHTLHPVLGMANTLLLLTGSLLVARGLNCMRSGSTRASRLFAGGFLCALAFAAVKSCEYALLVGEGYTGGTNDFFMYYFVFTGIHLAHLVIGAVILLVLAVQSRRPRRQPRQIRAAECGACYWHMVDLLWLVLFPLLYLVR